MKDLATKLAHALARWWVKLPAQPSSTGLSLRSLVAGTASAVETAAVGTHIRQVRYRVWRESLKRAGAGLAIVGVVLAVLAVGGGAVGEVLN